MIKLAGSALIIFATTGIGFTAGRDLKIRLDNLRYIKKLMLMLRGEIQYLKAPLGEAFFNVGKRARAPFDLFFDRIAQEIESLECESFYAIWCKHIDEELSQIKLTKPDCQTLKRVGEHLGYMDKEMQLGMIDLYVEQLEEEIKLSKENIDEKIRVYHCLGVAAGIFAVLIIL
ncbi:stage III sporulation protein AB [Konateibacter massiliensis]|uniref:stage III sporulation protein AB n=1 Tax=Konateibacter massiliensis TaxID=2002841 RepID=UPI000C149086|nr:stage III sporulation protein AB [Konateibacter massiliensis]